MRYLALFLMIASLAFFSIGCNQADQPSADPSPSATDDAGADDGAPVADEDEAEGAAEEGAEGTPE